jgi:trk system potassium uptake protein TrkH
MAHSQAMLRVIGLLMQVPGIMALLSIPICFIFQEYFALPSFVLVATLSLGIGQFLYRRYRQRKAIRYRQTLVIVALGWAIIFAFGTIPYLSIAEAQEFGTNPEATLVVYQNIWNALFESISGFTSTGLTMVRDSSQLPHSLQWWRSFSQWVGGIGLIVLTLSVLEPSNNVYQLYSAETREEQLAPTLRETAQEIGKIYLLYTAASVLLLRLAGMPLWAAINHGLCGMATGGFAITGSSFQNYGPVLQTAMIPIMVLGAISFATHSRIIRHREFSGLWRHTRYQLLWLLLVVGTGLILLERYWLVGAWQWIDSAFQWVSALTTCGFSTVDLSAWGPTTQIFMTLAMFFGAISGSTVGGLKLDRVAVLYKSVVWHLRLIYHESPEELRYEVDGQLLSETEAHRQLNSVVVLAMLWLAALGIGTLVLFHVTRGQFSLGNTLFECASALGTSGLSVGIAQPDLFWLGKLVLMLLMWLGRLEIVAVLVLFAWLTRPVKVALGSWHHPQRKTKGREADPSSWGVATPQKTLTSTIIGTLKYESYLVAHRK